MGSRIKDKVNDWLKEQDFDKAAEYFLETCGKDFYKGIEVLPDKSETFSYIVENKELLVKFAKGEITDFSVLFIEMLIDIFVKNNSNIENIYHLLEKQLSDYELKFVMRKLRIALLKIQLTKVPSKINIIRRHSHDIY